MFNAESIVEFVGGADKLPTGTMMEVAARPPGSGASGFVDQAINYKQKYVTRDNTATLLNHKKLSVKTIIFRINLTCF